MARILAIDSDEDLLSLYETLLAQEGHVVSCARLHTISVPALAVVQPELIIVDIMGYTQALTGWDLLYRLHTSVCTSNIPLLLCTAAYINSEQRFYLQAHNIDLLPKPFDIDAFVQKTSSLLYSPLGQIA